ncbi:probable inactive ATP-dependent zinc metalloprotease FTSHI 2, chloroplastic [Selaginella moellendorffii]|uniref:probable inactive ATP-dependent zinc metalloprotease FTSHI 2, chloroplastic n=1 Tax=Selaginella moellendorffii TaxID=88036 RepID=UPI000D1C35AA|nr:probable inactive ATP-dependent zinc metalloprotease FTSHI 2, chloroplastic [Selaginella moellendorffii]XP_024522588.1 probable inactive ATP-dependent zinc metalloprotease FTSHI 2, chloroplastic [Selaginella moellendorffii]|eukprot:XP_024522587.1 probable inactive ATP-dependent zinc metalloprotease FTSHI 2, chloroplastic [Selaginella moellendorffii]
MAGSAFITTVLQPHFSLTGECHSDRARISSSQSRLLRRTGSRFSSSSSLLGPDYEELSRWKSWRRREKSRISRHWTRAALQQDRDRADDEIGSKKKRLAESLLLRPVGFLLQGLCAAAAALVTVEAFRAIGKFQRSMPGAKKKKAQRFMTPEERKAWTSGLPQVEEHIAYDDIIRSARLGNVKHIIRHPGTKLREVPAEVFVVMDDDRVVRTVVPDAGSAGEFFKSWDELKLDKVVTEAYTPPPPPLEIPPWAMRGPSLVFLKKVEDFIKKPRERQAQRPQQDAYTIFQSAAAARLEELERQKLRRKREQMFRKQEEARKEAAKEQKFFLDQQMKMKEDSKASRALQRERRDEWNYFWATAANNESVRFTLGIFFFWLFYVTVVVGIKKRKQDYEDRIKIRKAEEAERREMKQVEMAMEKASRSGGTEMETDEENADAFKMGMRFMRSGAKMRQGRALRSGKYMDPEADVKFSDVAGLGNIRVELEEIVDFFTHAEKFRRRGSRIPTGILLCGEPGVGKTLLAKAVAGEAGVNFFAISASQFVEIYVGVGASRVRSLYSEANQNAPAVVFIDELDAVGRTRGLTAGSGGQERDSTLNQLLTCLDGFEGKGQVITIAATNRPDILDPALVRPGRFDRKIYIPKPSLQGRIEILQVHAKSKPMGEGIDYRAVGQITAGMAGAQLAHIVDVAALAALRDGRTEVTTDDLLEAAQNEEGGQPDLHIRSDRVRRILALQEASMAAMAANCPDMEDIQLMSIVPRMGEEKGFVRFKADPLKFGYLESISRQGFLDHITVQLAPRAADELWNGADQISTVASDNVDIARKAARSFVRAGHSDRKELYGLNSGCWYRQRSIWDVDVEAQKILESCYARALEYLERNRSFVNVLVDRLLEKGSIWRPEFLQLVEQYAVLDKRRSSPLEVRNMNRHAFEQAMMPMSKTTI